MSRSIGELCAAMAAGDRAALGKLYDRHAAPLLGIARRILTQGRDAEDLVHDLFLEAWRRADSYDPARGTVTTWLRMRLRSRAIDRMRSLAIARAHAMAPPEPSTEPTPVAVDPVRAVDQGRAREALGALTAVQREAVELAYFGGLSCSEIAARTGAPIGTVKSRLASGVNQLRERLARPGELQ